MGSEHAQYFATGAGATLRPAQYAHTGLAILWAGQPATRDGTQIPVSRSFAEEARRRFG